MTRTSSGRYPRRTTGRTVRQDSQRALRVLADAQVDYEQRFGWMVSVDTKALRITQATGDAMSAITMPEPLGTDVLNRLLEARQPVAVLTSGQGRWLTFLTRPQPATAMLSAILDMARVRVLPAGTPVVLPVPGQPHAEAWWVAPPTPRNALPLWSVVVESARRSVPAVAISVGSTRSRPVQASTSIPD